jgi:hypothetical protein
MKKVSYQLSFSLPTGIVLFYKTLNDISVFSRYLIILNWINIYLLYCINILLNIWTFLCIYVSGIKLFKTKQKKYTNLKAKLKRYVLLFKQVKDKLNLKSE